MSSRRTRLTRLVPALVAGLALSACAGSHPGTAVSVGGYSLSRADLDEVTSGLCAVAGSGQQQPTSRASTAQTTLALVVQSQQAIRYARTHDVSVADSALSAAQQGFERSVAGLGLSRAQRDALLDISALISRGQLLQEAVGAKKLGVPVEGSQAQQTIPAGTQVIASWAARYGPDVSIDPRYNLGLSKGQVQLRNGSVSVPVSTAGRQGASQQPSQDYLGSLPAPQRCG